MAKWSKSRVRELRELQILLREASGINQGNCCLERIRECIRLAKKLNVSSLSTPRKSFLQFLIAVAVGQEKPEEYPRHD